MSRVRPAPDATGLSADVLTVNVLGVFEVRLGDRVVDVPRGRMRVLLTTLALSAGRAVGIGTIAERLWGPSEPVHPRAAVHSTVRRLRRALGADDLILTRADGYLLDITPERVDALHFDSLVRAARGQDSVRALVTLCEALALWRGEPMSGLDAESLDDGQRTALTARYLDALELRIDLELGCDQYESAIPELRVLTERDPLRESAWHRLMLALHAVGRPAEALDAFTRIRDELRRSLGREPSAELRELHRAILTADAPAPELSAPPFRPEPSMPQQLPALTGTFVGRTAQLAALDSLLATVRSAPGSPPLIVVIDGAAGTGKTALAVRWAHGVRGGLAGELYADLRGHTGGTAASPDGVLAAFLRALGLPAGQVPDGVAQRSAVLRSLLETRPVLMVLDDARDAEQVRPLLPGSAGVVLVTSRNQLRGLATREGARRVTLGHLDQADAVTLLTDAIGATRADTDPAAVAELAELCGRLPLALRILGERVRRRPAPLAAIAAELRDERTRLSMLADPHDPSVDLGVLLSWSYRELDADAAALFRGLALLPGEDFDLPAAASLAGATPARTAVLLDRLVAGNLIEQPRPDRYRFHDLLRTYAVDRGGSGRVVRPDPDNGGTYD
jgi:DNA-binding SARP family transcriptional activator